jgi:SAM-dependent methyltransferase
VERPSWAPAHIDVDRPSIARVYDYYLGGSHNFAADREFALTVLEAMPDLTRHAQENRAFLRRAVRHLAQAGIRQFVDLGSGIPTAGNVHEVAHAVAPDARVVYVDVDPVAVAHSRAILAREPFATVLHADLRKPDEVLHHRALRALIDLDQPVGVLLVSVLHFVSDEEAPDDVVAGYARAVAPGSHVVISHASTHGQPRQAAGVQELYRRSVSAMTMRSRDRIAALFGDLTLVEPGVVQMPRWRPDSTDDLSPDVDDYPGFAGVGRRD